MTSQRWRQIEALYHSACERGAAVLDGADPDLRREVEKLLAQDSASGPRLLDHSASDLIRDLIETPVSPGARLGPYKIEALLGKGGMGQVFRATDTRLTRRVAIKICNEPFLDRFEQEARAIAAISHPNVCTLYDVGPNYLVMELVDGETLAARLKRGRLSLADTLRYGAQIAEALAIAHAAGIIHRDLKPGNIMLAKSGGKSGIKVLDFGLAKSDVDLSLTEPDGVMGTPAYLAPERLEGKDADPRSDIYALGLILAEMATGKRSADPTDLAPQLERVIHRCLQPDPDERWQSARDLKWELESIAEAPAAPPARRHNLLLLSALAAVVLLAAALAFTYLRPSAPPQPLTRTNILLPEKSLVRSLAVSPDGRYIAIVLVKDGRQQIWVRALDATELTPLAGTDNAVDPFWSADSRHLAFFADARLKKIDRSGGPVQTLCDALGAVGGTWNQNGDILIGALTGVQRISESGALRSELPGNATYPAFLPDGQHYVSRRATGVWLNSLDGHDERQLLPDISRTAIVDAPPGSHIGAILFTRAGTLMALPFDYKNLIAAGEPSAVAQQIGLGTNSSALLAASYNGLLAYISGQNSQRQYTWRDRDGKTISLFGDAGGVVGISPDGKRLVGDPSGVITLLDFAHGSTTRLTLGAYGGMNPAWSSDGRYVAYNGEHGISAKPPTGARRRNSSCVPTRSPFPKAGRPTAAI
ncbi:protein kinase domain-containing protein [Occallatibacter savannae]|uniref:protein kinase domain-containing protein n=1 Tax=Occallatibacter savannae TaxID=1002691 RepID=UPI000D695103|nr:protein kinase [Occallatibacter savannae]